MHSAEVAPQGDTKLDSLQRDVDPNLLVPSNGKGPTTRRKKLTQKAPKARVKVHNIIFVHVLGVSMLICVQTHTLCRFTAETLCASTASAGGGTSRRQASSFCIPHCKGDAKCINCIMVLHKLCIRFMQMHNPSHSCIIRSSIRDSNCKPK